MKNMMMCFSFKDLLISMEHLLAVLVLEQAQALQTVY